MSTNAWLRSGLLLAAMALFVAATTPAQGREPRKFGKHMVAQYQLPPDAIARYATMAAGAAQNVARREESMFADRSPWVGPKQRAGVGQNPYTLVFTVSGVAKAAGEVQAQWQAGWEIQESPVASRELLMAVPRMARTGVTAGQPLTLTASSTRVSFRGERNVAPMLGLVQMRNLDISDVRLQVWSGEAAQAWSLPALPRGVLVAMGLACLVFSACPQAACGVGPPRGRRPLGAARRGLACDSASGAWQPLRPTCHRGSAACPRLMWSQARRPSPASRLR